MAKLVDRRRTLRRGIETVLRSDLRFRAAVSPAHAEATVAPFGPPEGGHYVVEPDDAVRDCRSGVKP